MKKGIVASLTAALILTSILITGADARCKSWHCQPRPTPTVSPTTIPTPTIIPIPTPTTNPTPTIIPTPTATTIYSFADEFNGTALGSVWKHDYLNGWGWQATDDPRLSTVSNGYLHIRAEKRTDGHWYSDLIDTKNTFMQTYGYFEARMDIPRGRGYWPAFWLYAGSFGTDGDEIDVMEVCANPTGTNGGNDVTDVHQTVHKGTQSNQKFFDYRGLGDSSLNWHTYAVDWRPSKITFFVDGIQTWSETTLLISTPKQLMFDFAIGGSWCGASDATTPTSAETLVDWIHVKP